PTTPTGLTTALAGSNTVNLQWAASSDATGVTGYRLYRNGVILGTSTTLSYVDTSVTTATSYSYTVAAYDAAGNVSSQSSAATVTTAGGDTEAPSAPTNVSASAIQTTTLTVSWSAASDNVGVSGYVVKLNGENVGQTSSTTYSLAGLTPSTTYTIAV